MSESVTPARGRSRDAGCLDVLAFAHGALRHERTRVRLREIAGEALAGREPAQRETRVALPGGDGFRFDGSMQGGEATVFFEH